MSCARPCSGSASCPTRPRPRSSDLGATAPTLNRLITQLGPFADASRPAVRSLGKASVEGSRALKAVEPIIPKLRLFAQTARPTSANLAKLVTSLRDTGGVERIMDFLFYTVGATNGFDQIGRFLRVNLLAPPELSSCAIYAAAPSAPTPARLPRRQSTAARTSTGPRRRRPAPPQRPRRRPPAARAKPKRAAARW